MLKVGLEEEMRVKGLDGSSYSEGIFLVVLGLERVSICVCFETARLLPIMGRKFEQFFDIVLCHSNPQFCQACYVGICAPIIFIY